MNNYLYFTKSLVISLTILGILALLGIVGCSGSGSKSQNQSYSKPLPPASLTAIAGNARVSLNWSASTGATGYIVYGSQTSGSYVSIATTTSISFTVTNITNNIPYYCAVTAINSAGESGYSNEVVAIPVASINTYNVGLEPGNIAVDASGNVWVVNYYSNTVTKLSASGITIGTYSVGQYPFGIAIDASGNVWVANGGDNTVCSAFLIIGLFKGKIRYNFLQG